MFNYFLVRYRIVTIVNYILLSISNSPVTIWRKGYYSFSFVVSVYNMSKVLGILNV